MQEHEALLCSSVEQDRRVSIDGDVLSRTTTSGTDLRCESSLTRRGKDVLRSLAVDMSSVAPPRTDTMRGARSSSVVDDFECGDGRRSKQVLSVAAQVISRACKHAMAT